MLRADPFLTRLDGGLLTPRNKILEFDVAGRVEAVGSAARQFRPGDEVFGNLFELRGGAFAQYVSERLVALKPDDLAFEAAAAVSLAEFTALQGLRNKGQIQPAQKVLINEASGGVGTFAMRLANAFGAKVTGVSSTRNLGLVRSIGADHVVDYTREDFTNNRPHYDLIYDAVGNRSVADYRCALGPKGRCVIAGFSTVPRLLEYGVLGPRSSRAGGQTIGPMGTAQPNKTDLAVITDLLEASQIVPIIDRCYPLSEMAEAIRYLETGRAKGKVIIRVA